MINSKDQAKILKMFMDNTGYTEEEMSERSHIPLKIMKNLISGKSIITTSQAVLLESELGLRHDNWEG